MGGLQAFPVLQSMWHGLGPEAAQTPTGLGLSHGPFEFFQGELTFSLKGQRVTVLSFVTPMVSVTAISAAVLHKQPQKIHNHMSVAGSL